MIKRTFRLGRVVITRGARDKLWQADIMHALLRHLHGDWGDVCREDWEANEQALWNGGRLLSAYHAKNVKFWIITEAEPRDYTTILLPEEY